MDQLTRELLRILVSAEDVEDEGGDVRAEFDRLIGTDRVILDMLWAKTRA